MLMVDKDCAEMLVMASSLFLLQNKTLSEYFSFIALVSTIPIYATTSNNVSFGSLMEITDFNVHILLSSAILLDVEHLKVGLTV